MDKRQRRKFDKLLLNMLARNPASFRLVADEGGWVRIKDIHKALLEEKLFPGMTPAGIEQHLLLFRPAGFEYSNGRVRALPVLQAPGIFDYQVARPPEMLFTPIRPKALRHVDGHGLTAADKAGWLVLLSSGKDALLFGKRFHNRPVLCKIIASKASQGGVTFRHAGSGLYLSEKVERQWLILPEIREKPASEKQKIKSGTGIKATESTDGEEIFRDAGSFFPSVSSFETLFQKKAGTGRKRRSKKRSRYLDKKKSKK